MKRVFSFTFVALMMLCGAAWAQDGLLGGLAGAVFGAVGTTDFVTGGALPFLIMLVVQSNWTWKAKANISWMLCFIAAIIIAAFQGQLVADFSSLPVVFAKFVAIATSAKNIYDGAYKPLGIADAVTKATDVLKPTSLPSNNPALDSIPPAPSNVLDETPGAFGDFNVPATATAAGGFNVPTPSSPVTSENIDLSDDAVEKIVRGLGGVLVDYAAKKL